MPFMISNLNMADFRFKLPSLSALSAFESAARHCNFSRAAEELRTSQPAVSRHISGLEGMLGAALFERERNRVSLTPDGQRLYHAVVAGFQEIGRAIDEIAQRPRRQTLTIACSYDVAHLWLMPRHDGLQDLLGAGTDIRIVASEYEHQSLIQDRDTDISLTYLNPLARWIGKRSSVRRRGVSGLCAQSSPSVMAREITAGDLARVCRFCISPSAISAGPVGRPGLEREEGRCRRGQTSAGSPVMSICWRPPRKGRGWRSAGPDW